MATQYSPDGAPLPLAMGNFGSSQSTIDPATRTPTMAESKFYNWQTHGQTQPDYMRTNYDFNTGGYSQPMGPQSYGGGVTPQGYNAPAPNRGGGFSIQQDYNAPVPVGAGPLWSRYQSVQTNPAALTADPAYQFLFNQGQEALNRTAAARRMRFAGKTMLDAQNFGQGLAAQNFRTMLGELRAGAQDEYGRDLQNARAKAASNSSQIFGMDPYGAGRGAAAYRTFEEYLASVPGLTGPTGYQKAMANWQLGQRTKQLMGG